VLTASERDSSRVLDAIICPRMPKVGAS